MIVWIRLKLLCFSGAVTAAACGGQHEAADPHGFIEGTKASDGRAGDPAPTDPHQAEPAAKAPTEDPLAPAARGDCEAAARHLEERGAAAAAADAAPGERAGIVQRALQDPATQSRIRKTADDCLARSTTRREAACIARAADEADIDHCTVAR